MLINTLQDISNTSQTVKVNLSFYRWACTYLILLAWFHNLLAEKTYFPSLIGHRARFKSHWKPGPFPLHNRIAYTAENQEHEVITYYRSPLGSAIIYNSATRATNITSYIMPQKIQPITIHQRLCTMGGATPKLSKSTIVHCSNVPFIDLQNSLNEFLYIVHLKKSHGSLPFFFYSVRSDVSL